jgi:L-threonylcarbamoyladenylate synthase
MIILDYDQKNHKSIIHAVSLAMKHGKVVAYPTDTSYGLAVDITNKKSVDLLYKIKSRNKKQPIHLVVSGVAQAKQIAVWNKYAGKLAKSFWPGALSLVLPLGTKQQAIAQFSGGTSTIGLRMPDNKIALDLVRQIGQPIPAVSANPAGKENGIDSYSSKEIIEQFAKQKYKPDIIINAGRLPKRKPSTLIAINDNGDYKLLRQGPISETKIKQTIK